LIPDPALATVRRATIVARRSVDMASVARFRLVHQDPSAPAPVTGTVEQFSGGNPTPPPMSTTAAPGSPGVVTAVPVVPPPTDTVEVEVKNAAGVTKHVNCPCPVVITDVRATVTDATNVRGTVMLNNVPPTFSF
jgi:hypothetical protein